jgi:hypothetical protein
MGIDGEWVRPDMLKVPPNYFAAFDLSKPFDLKRRFDLVISLEVAEHLPESASSDFVHTLSRHGDIILFSEAIPGQWGTNHLNEQWPPYRIDLFADLGYSKFDFIRGRIWHEMLISPWYAQNIFLFANDSGVARCPSILEAAQNCAPMPLHIVHPGLLHLAHNPGIKGATSMTIRAVQMKIKRLLH